MKWNYAQSVEVCLQWNIHYANFTRNYTWDFAGGNRYKFSTFLLISPLSKDKGDGFVTCKIDQKLLKYISEYNYK